MKKIFISAILVFSLAILLPFFYIDEIRSVLRAKLSPEIKVKFKETVFGKEYMDQIAYYKKIGYNKRVFPDTQFITLEVKKYLIEDLDIAGQSHYDKVMGQVSTKFRFYLERINNDLIISTAGGSIKVVKDLNFENIINIQTNLNTFQDKMLMDAKVVNDYLYLSLKANPDVEKKKCKYFYVVRAKFNEKFLDFSNFYETNKCALNNYGGRITLGKIGETRGLILTTGATESESNLAQDDESHLGKLLFLDFNNPVPKIISKGHRNPQGLYVENNLILSTEHGPYGGDEINKIELGKNYGWPIVSLGDNHGFDKLRSKERQKKLDYVYKKDHQANGFDGPIFTYITAVGISEIIKVPSDFSKYWQNNFLIASLNGGSLYRVSFDKNFTKVNYSEKIELLDRIRDIIYIPQIRSFALSLEDHGEVWLIKSTE